MKVTVLLRKDHEALRSLFTKYTRAGARNQNGGKKEMFGEIQREIMLHSQMETGIFYPALAATASAVAQEGTGQAHGGVGRYERAGPEFR
jgi:hypothetical protein